MFKVFDRSRRQRSTCRQLQSNSVTLRIITILVSVPFYAYNGRYAFPNVLSCKPNYIGFPVLAMTLIVGKVTVGNTPLIDIIAQLFLEHIQTHLKQSTLYRTYINYIVIKIKFCLRFKMWMSIFKISMAVRPYTLPVLKISKVGAWNTFLLTKLIHSSKTIRFIFKTIIRIVIVQLE